MAAAKVGSRNLGPGGINKPNHMYEIIVGDRCSPRPLLLVGYVEIWIDPMVTYVRYSTIGSWALNHTYLHFAEDWQLIPQNNNGEPIPELFDYQQVHGLLNEYTYMIPCTQWRYGAAGCVVHNMINSQQEFGWARDRATQTYDNLSNPTWFFQMWRN